MAGLGGAGREFPRMPRCGAAADGCCGKVLPFAAASASASRSGSRPAPVPPARPPAPALACAPGPAMNPPSAAGEDKGAAGSSSCCRGAEGGGDTRSAAAAAAALEEPGVGSQKDESLEDKLRNLTFRKQVSYRWARGAGQRGTAGARRRQPCKFLGELRGPEAPPGPSPRSPPPSWELNRLSKQSWAKSGLSCLPALRVWGGERLAVDGV